MPVPDLGKGEAKAKAQGQSQEEEMILIQITLSLEQDEATQLLATLPSKGSHQYGIVPVTIAGLLAGTTEAPDVVEAVSKKLNISVQDK